MKIIQTIKADPSWTAFLAAVFAMGVSMPLARLLIAVCFVLSLRPSSTIKPKFHLTWPVIGWMAYFAIAFIVTEIMATVNTDELIVPREGLGKITKLLWYALIPLAAAQVNSEERLSTTLKALVCGCALTGLGVILMNPVAAWIQVTLPDAAQIAAGTLSPAQASLLNFTNALHITDSINDWIVDGYRAADYMGAMFKLGTMQDAQRLMVALPAALCLCLVAFREHHSRRTRVISSVAAAIVLAGLVLTFKRGPLIFGVLATSAILVRLVGARALAAIAIVCIVTAMLPAARLRFSQLPEELSAKKGGRMLMWTQVVPKIHAEHPYGIGFRSLTNDKMRQFAPRVELRQNHVHSNPLQSFVDFGWLGVCVYLFWMMAAIATAVCGMNKNREAKGPWSVLRYAPLAMLSALMLYGLMEYNLADAEIVLLYSIAMGIASFRPPAPTSGKPQ